MKRLFVNILQQVLKNELNLSLNINNIQNLSNSIKAKYGYDITYSKLSRLPLNQIQTVLKVPCITKDIPNIEQIIIFKRLRSNLKVDQISVCLKCSKKCSFRAIQFKDLPQKPKKSNKSALSDLFYYLIILSQQQEINYSGLRWGSAYRTALALQYFIKDISYMNRQSLLLREAIRFYQNQQQKKHKQKKSQEAQIQNAKKLLATRKITL